MPVALALSPHLDDAAFSCGGTLALLARRGWQVVLCTVFTATVDNPTGFALACQTDKGVGPEVDYMALRRDEDRAAAEALGLGAPLWLPFPEAPHRGYGSAAELFGGLRPDDGITEPVAEAIGALVQSLAPDLLLAPQAVGGHVDHVAVVDVIRRLAPAEPIAWWRDSPYAARDGAPAEPFRDGMAALPEDQVVLTPEPLAAKRAACLAYGSQIPFQFGGPDGLDATLARSGTVERFRLQGAVNVRPPEPPAAPA
jgi:LmbE family N-acetylglucosaminyl deacetylase